MDAIQKKELLHLRIEQANEQMLDALAEMAETLFKTWQPEVVDTERQQRIDAYEASLKPMTKEELVERAKASDEDIKAGRIHTLEEVDAMLGL